jgi:hypothetical protein
MATRAIDQASSISTFCARGDIDVKKAATIFDELDRLPQAISRRAYHLFRNGRTHRNLPN